MKTKQYWTNLVSEANKIRKELDGKPEELKIGYWLSPGSILNAYREGDLTFNEAVKELTKRTSQAPAEKHAERMRILLEDIRIKQADNSMFRLPQNCTEMIELQDILTDIEKEEREQNES